MWQPTCAQRPAQDGQPPRRPEPVLDRWGQLLLAVGVVLPLVCLALVLLVS